MPAPDVEIAPTLTPQGTSRLWLAYAAGWGVFLAAEFYAWRSAPDSAQRAGEWFLHADVDALVILVFLIAAPLIGWLRGPSRRWYHLTDMVAAGTRSSVRRGVCLSLIVGGASVATSATVARKFDNLPPAFHDEYSYLFQSRTFLAGRTSFPSHEEPRLFDQMHVLNEGHYASRYFPGPGLWMAPFVALGHPYWGHWLAGGCCSALVFWIGRELAGDAGGLLAGLLTAISPGMALFSNLLLAHQPTLVGLSLFIWAYLRMIATGRTVWGIAAGTGLAFAMLCRPMTAAGVALPFGLYQLYWTLRSHPAPPNVDVHIPPDRPARLKLLAAIAGPLVAGFALLYVYNQSITGSGWLTPYSLYTDLHTPRHVYGFNNVVRGEQRWGPRVIEKYDRWAENLTAELAARNVYHRVVASSVWTLGLIPSVLALAAGLLYWRRLSTPSRLILAAIVSLHLAHVPYWFVGIEGYHYVFESGPLWLVWVAVVTREAVADWRAECRVLLPLWWGALIAATVIMNFSVSGGTWSAPFDQGTSRVAYARRRHGRFEALLDRDVHPRPAIVLVDPDPADYHIDYVNNSPDLSGEVLIGRFLPDQVPLEKIQRLFPGRSVWIYRAWEERLEPFRIDARE